MADAGGEGGESSERPSFTNFWKRVKQKEKDVEGDGQKKKGKGKKAETQDDVEGGGGAEQQQDGSPDQNPDQDADEPTATGDDAAAAKDKAQIRRAQVRKAQIQHRQRKANYVKQLELDVSQLRDLINQTQQETSQMRKENDTIRDLIRGTEPVMPQQQQQPSFTHADSTYFSTTGSPGTRLGGGVSELDAQEWLAAGGQLSDLDLNQQQPLMPSTSNEQEMFGHINLDDITVSLGINDLLGTPCFTINNPPPPAGSSTHGFTSPPNFESPPLTPPLTPQQEQIVINWILALENVCWDHFQANDFHEHIPGEAEPSSNHILTATSLLMNAAPPSIFTDRQVFAGIADPATTQAPTFQWHAPAATGISIASLWALAQFEVDPAEISPVQIWFDLASKYPYELLFADGLLTSLLIELRPFIRCIEYGAAVNRQFYLDVVERMIGPPPVV
ncbi:hypothetical protein BBK36DRAFT_1121636 [Trichoderma citrinoviride]|uniref:BZIP domain-containing protein n=1 Tax=Trichoderma citrinoviride TaxID=58853 RepID=A0A2T4B7W5_9HYPO|nr:hypothetical protein BBK36DRAFT_1121636 [Trichoderma citrinoviride]PTB65400.1 hypothetical protein BBK36DRAFT_1121636 [Trichoderma citrinoviride]